MLLRGGRRSSPRSSRTSPRTSQPGWERGGGREIIQGENAYVQRQQETEEIELMASPPASRRRSPVTLVGLQTSHSHVPQKEVIRAEAENTHLEEKRNITKNVNCKIAKRLSFTFVRFSGSISWSYSHLSVTALTAPRSAPSLSRKPMREPWVRRRLPLYLQGIETTITSHSYKKLNYLHEIKIARDTSV